MNKEHAEKSIEPLELQPQCMKHRLPGRDEEKHVSRPNNSNVIPIAIVIYTTFLPKSRRVRNNDNSKLGYLFLSENGHGFANLY